jgi:hypothetical protein
MLGLFVASFLVCNLFLFRLVDDDTKALVLDQTIEKVS